MSFIEGFFGTMLLPFLLVFVVTFAILQKSKILGDGKAQIDAMVALAIGLILIGFPQPRDIVVALMPWLAVGIAVILVFFILYGFVAGDLTSMPRGLKITFGILAGIFTFGVVLYVTGLGNFLFSLFEGTEESSIWANIIFIVLITGAAIWAITGSKPKTSKPAKGGKTE